VYLVKEKNTARTLAIKSLEKQHVVKFNKIKHVHREKEILNRFADHPNIIRLETTF
jgi:serine/threonine protein kinase